jgi:hypothetical protein
MRFHLRKTLTYVAAAVVLVIVVNFYGNNIWEFQTNNTGWGSAM